MRALGSEHCRATACTPLNLREPPHGLRSTHLGRYPRAPDAVFASALGVVQNNKSYRILAVHNGGRRMVLREKSMMSNPKIHHILVEDRDDHSELFVAVTTDPRSTRALLDGKANEKSMTKYVENVHAALSGAAPAPMTPVADHYLQRKTEVPWVDPEPPSEIMMDGNLLAIYNF